MLNDKIERKLKAENDYGLFALDKILKGELIWKEDDVDKTLYLTREDIEKLSPEELILFKNNSFQVDIDLYGGYTDRELLECDHSMFINHSCDPNAWYEGSCMVARRDIMAGEEILYDYGTDSMNRVWDFQCNCGSEKCRGRVTTEDWKMLAVEYGEHMSPYIVRFLKNEK